MLAANHNAVIEVNGLVLDYSAYQALSMIAGLKKPQGVSCIKF
jgi:hypothetical protein